MSWVSLCQHGELFNQNFETFRPFLLLILPVINLSFVENLFLRVSLKILLDYLQWIPQVKPLSISSASWDFVFFRADWFNLSNIKMFSHAVIVLFSIMISSKGYYYDDYYFYGEDYIEAGIIEPFWFVFPGDDNHSHSGDENADRDEWL